jgi:hypothetical protein
VLDFAFVSSGEVLQRSMATFLLQARDKKVALTLRTITEDDGPAVGDSNWVNGTRGSGSAELDALESGLGALELYPHYKLIGTGPGWGRCCATCCPTPSSSLIREEPWS